MTIIDFARSRGQKVADVTEVIVNNLDGTVTRKRLPPEIWPSLFQIPPPGVTSPLNGGWYQVLDRRVVAVFSVADLDITFYDDSCSCGAAKAGYALDSPFHSSWCRS